MNQSILVASGMHCQNCSNKVIQKIEQLDPWAEVTIDLTSQTIHIQSQLINLDEATHLVDSLGFTVQQASSL